jgi:hypothetical protein
VAKIHNQTAEQLAAIETAIVNDHKAKELQILADAETIVDGRRKLPPWRRRGR